MRRPNRKTLWRVAILRELASLGRTKIEAAILCDVSPSCISQYCRRFGFTMRPGSAARPWLRKLILRDFGKEGLTQSMMAERYGTSRLCIRVRIHQLRAEGLLPPPKNAKIDRQLEAQS